MVLLRRSFVVGNVEADRIVQETLDEILRFPAATVHTGHFVRRFRPEIARIERISSVFDRNQVVFFIVK